MDDLVKEAGDLSLGGTCWKGEVSVIDLGPGRGSSAREWECAVRATEDGALVL